MQIRKKYVERKLVDRATCLLSQLWERGQIQRANQLTVITMPLLATSWVCVGSDKIPLIYYVHPVTACARRGNCYVVREIHRGTSVFGCRVPGDAGISINERVYYQLLFKKICFVNGIVLFSLRRATLSLRKFKRKSRKKLLECI